MAEKSPEISYALSSGAVGVDKFATFVNLTQAGFGGEGAGDACDHVPVEGKWGNEKSEGTRKKWREVAFSQLEYGDDWTQYLM